MLLREIVGARGVSGGVVGERALAGWIGGAEEGEGGRGEKGGGFDESVVMLVLDGPVCEVVEKELLLHHTEIQMNSYEVFTMK